MEYCDLQRKIILVGGLEFKVTDADYSKILSFSEKEFRKIPFVNVVLYNEAGFSEVKLNLNNILYLS